MSAVPKAVLILPLLESDVLLPEMLLPQHPEEEAEMRELQNHVHAQTRRSAVLLTCVLRTEAQPRPLEEQEVKTYIGIDPGKAGCIAVSKGNTIKAHKMPETDTDIWALFKSIMGEDEIDWRDSGVFAVLETVHSSPQMGVKSAFTFGQGYGGLRMALIASGIPFEGVTPQKWQKALGCLSGGDKNKTKDRAQTLFPQIKVSHAIADGLLLAEYCRRTYP